MFCTHCGKELPANAKFCTACGTPITADEGQSKETEMVLDSFVTVACLIIVGFTVLGIVGAIISLF